jgi:hypothetical protein
MREAWESQAMRVLFTACLALLTLLAASAAWAQQRPARIALIIANAAYPSAPSPLPTAMADARSLAYELRRDGFDVDLRTDVRKPDMQGAIDAFTRRIAAGADALFYFSGYGLQVDRQTYLMPVNADVWAPADVRRDGFSVNSIVAEMHRKGARVKVLIVDAARKNPWEQRFRFSPEGLAVIDLPENTLAVYSAAPGMLITERPGSNSLFTGELLKEMHAADTSAEDVFNHVRRGVSRASKGEQIPWVASSLVQEFFFSPRQIDGGTQESMAEPIELPKPPPAPLPSPAPNQESVPVPEFPWPPPAASASYVLPRGLFEAASTMGTVAGLIISALERSGYVERSFFKTKAGGIALVMRLERIDDDGSPAPDKERWPSALDNRSFTDLASFLRGIFYADPGRYRVIVFIFQEQPFAQSREEVTGPAARSWLSEGLNALPRELAQRSFAEGDCTALIYEFASTGAAVSRVASRLTGKQHLEQAGVLAQLQISR